MFEMARKDALAFRGQAELGFWNAGIKAFLARDIAGILQLARMDAQVAVRRLQELFELRERHAWRDAERAHDPETHALVDEAVRLAGLAVREIPRHGPQPLRLRSGRPGLLTFQHRLTRHGASRSSSRARGGCRRNRARARYGPSPAAAIASPCRAP